MTRVQIQIDGGIAAFPGLSRPVSIDISALCVADQTQFEQLVAESRFFEQPKVVKDARGADLRQYTVTIESEGHKRTVRIRDPISDPHLESLVQFLVKHKKGPASSPSKPASAQHKQR